MRYRIEVRNLTECCVMMTAIRTHCDNQIKHYNDLGWKFKNDGDEDRATRMFQERDNVRRTRDKTLASLDRIYGDLNNWTDYNDQSDSSGYSTDNATCYN